MSVKPQPPAPQSPPRRRLEDAIDRIFAEYALLFPAQFRKSYPSPEHIRATKKLWRGFFSRYDARRLLQAARERARNSPYVPTHYEVDRQCARLAGLPETEQAWREACNAMAPLELWRWSHPAVYHAARLCENSLQEESRNTAFTMFRRRYEDLRRQALEGADLRLPRVLPGPQPKSLPRPQAGQQLAEMRKKLRL